MAPRASLPGQGPATPPSSPERTLKIPKSSRIQKKARSVSGPPTLSKPRTPQRQSAPSVLISTSESVPTKPNLAQVFIDLTLDETSDVTSSDLSTRQNPSTDSDLPISPIISSLPTCERDDREISTTSDTKASPGAPTAEDATCTQLPSMPGKKNNKPWHYDELLCRYLHDPVKTTKQRTQGGTPSRRISAGEKDKKSGYVYVLKRRQDAEFVDGDDTPVVKVGSSFDPISRCKKIEKECRLDLEQVINREQRLLRQCGLAEKLAQKELAPWKHKFHCRCDTKHGEYFQVSDTDALKVVRRWVTFCHRRPWDDHGRLKSFWARRLDACRLEWKNEEHDVSDERWEEYTRPWFWEEPYFEAFTMVELLVMKIRRLLVFVMEHRWPLLFFAQGLYTMYTYGEANSVLILSMVAAAGIIMTENTEAD